MICRSLLPLAGVVFLKRLVDGLVPAITASSAIFPGNLIWLIIALVSILLTDDLLLIFSRYSTKKQAQLLEEHVTGIIHSHASVLGLKSFEDNSFHELLSRASNDASWRPASIVTNFILFLRGTVSFVAMATLISHFNILLMGALLLAFIPAFFSRANSTKRLYKSRSEQTPLIRKASYFSWLITGERPAREVKLFGLGSYFNSQFKKYFNEAKEAELKTIREASVSEVVAALVKALIFTGIIIYFTLSMTHGKITVGAMAMYLVAFRQAMVYLRDAVTGLSGVKEDKLFLNDFFSFVDRREDIIAQEPVIKVPETNERIEISGLTFSYPGNTIPALQDINLSITRGEKIAIVGANGSGKTTLVKLLCRLYDPDDGVIKYSGNDIKHYEPEEYRKQFSVVFQDFMLYFLSVRENIGISDLNRQHGDEAIHESAEDAGLNGFFKNLPDGYDTMLGHLTPDGRELSWGEWQKIAIARSLFRKAPVLILDEPSSSLDADSEYEIFSRLDEIAAGRTCIFISHRLSNIKPADRIIVLSNGHLAESGTHDQLIAEKGIYFKMYNQQKSLYK